jgi:hypothetical protein
MASQNYHQYQDGQCTVCGQPARNKLKRGMRGLALCPGVMRI